MIDSLRARQYRDWARADLARYLDAEKDLSHCQSRLDKLLGRINRLSQPLDPDKIHVQVSNNGPEDAMCSLVVMREKLNPKIIASKAIIEEVLNRIEEIEDNTYRRILTDIWIHQTPLAEVAVMEGYQYQTIRVKHSEALEKYGEKYQHQSTPVNTNQQKKML